MSDHGKVRAACVRILQHADMTDDDAELVAGAWLEEHQPDDDQPADFEWLISQCEQHTGGGDFDDSVWWEKGAVSFSCKDSQSDPGSPVETVASDWQVDGQQLSPWLVPETRGQFRLLCRLANS